METDKKIDGMKQEKEDKYPPRLTNGCDSSQGRRTTKQLFVLKTRSGFTN
jgi:hypothetical protein